MSLESIFYNKLYSYQEAPYGTEPDSQVSHILDYKKSGTVIDLGAGEGRNAHFLAKAGFNVTAVDFSQSGLDQIHKKSRENHTRIKTEWKDLTKTEIANSADIFVCSFVLHNLKKEEALTLIEKMKKATNTDGINAVSVFMDESDFFRKHPQENHFSPKSGELKALYEDWEILEYSEEKVESRELNEDGTAGQNTQAKILARKSKVGS